MKRPCKLTKTRTLHMAVAYSTQERPSYHLAPVPVSDLLPLRSSLPMKGSVERKWCLHLAQTHTKRTTKMFYASFVSPTTSDLLPRWFKRCSLLTLRLTWLWPDYLLRIAAIVLACYCEEIELNWKRNISYVYLELWACFKTNAF